MPNWKKLITSGSNAVLNQVTASSFLSTTTTGVGFVGTASWAQYVVNGGGTPGGPLSSIQFNSASQFSGSSNFTYDAPNSTVYLTGSIVNIDTNTSRSLDTGQRSLFDQHDFESINWHKRWAINSVGDTVVDWSLGQLLDHTTLSIDWANRNLYLSDGTTVSIDWEGGAMYDGFTIMSVDYGKFRRLYDQYSSQSIDWNTRQLKKADGSSLAADWSLDNPRWYGLADSASLATSASKVNTVRTTNNADYYLTFVDSINTGTGDFEQLYTSAGPSISYNPSTNALSVTRITASLHGTASWAQNLAGSVASAAQVETIYTSSTALFYPTFVDSKNITATAEKLYTGEDSGKGIYIIPNATDGVTFYSYAISSSVVFSTANPNVVGFIGTASWAQSASIAKQVETIRSSTNATHYLTFVDSNNPSASPENLYTQTNITYNPSTLLLSATNLSATSITGSIISASSGITGSLFGTASWAQSSSQALTASFITSSNVYGPNGSNSIATASFVTSIKSGVVTSFGGNPKTGSVTFSPAYANASYAVTVTGVDARSWTIQSKASTGFTINSNSNTALTGDVYWIAVPYNG